MRKSGLTGDEAYVLSKRRGTSGDLGPLKKEIGLIKEDLSNLSSSKISKFYATNNGENHLADSDDGKIADMMVYGKSEQKSTMGKNLLKISEVNVQGGANGLLSTMNTDGSISVTGTSTSTWSNIIKINNECHTDNATYTFSVDKNSGIIIGLKLGQTELDDANYQTHRIVQNQLSCTFETGASNEYCSLFLEGLTVGKSYNFTIYPMLELGTEATAYEPYTGGQPSPSPDYPQEIKSVVNPTVKVTNEDGLKVQSVTLNNIILNAIPVSSGGNVTIDGQQYIADYVDVERGKLVKRVYEYVFSGKERWTVATDGAQYLAWRVGNNPGIIDSTYDKKCLCSCLIANILSATRKGENYISTQSLDDTCRVWVSANVATSKLTGEKVFLALIVPEEISLTQEEIRAFKELAAYYPVTNVNVASEQLNGYTVFNYPVSMKNGWNYVKQQLNDNRDYIYDMDLQSTEAYVNSEYAVALTELEV